MALSKVDLANMVENVAPESSIPDVSFRNIIINGDMSIAQRSTSETSQTSSGYICVDRFRHGINNQGTWTISQSTDVPTGQGFAKSMKMDCTTADASPAADDYIWFEQKIEGQNLQYLKKGTSNAESVTVSFWVYATKTGTNVLEFLDKDNTRHICQTYTINSSNTWEKKTITFAGDTTGTFNFDNGESASLLFWIGAGSNYQSGTLATSWASVSGAAGNRAVGQVNHADSTSNNFYLTGIQLEAGTSASDFEFLPVDVNSMRCFRYYYMFADRVNSDQRAIGLGTVHYANQVTFEISYPTPMRANPSIDQVYATDTYTFYHNTTGDDFDGVDAIASVGNRKTLYRNHTDMSASVNECGQVYVKLASGYMAADAEL